MIEQPFAFQSACATLGFSKCREVRAICSICAGRAQTQTSRIGKKWWKAPPWRKSFRPHKETRTTHPALRKETPWSFQKQDISVLAKRGDLTIAGTPLLLSPGNTSGGPGGKGGEGRQSGKPFMACPDRACRAGRVCAPPSSRLSGWRWRCRPRLFSDPGEIVRF